MARPPVGRVVHQQCRCGTVVLTARDVLDDRVTIGADERWVSVVEAAQAMLAGRPAYAYDADHAGHSWLQPLFPPAVRRWLLGLERPRLMLVLDHTCPTTEEIR